MFPEKTAAALARQLAQSKLTQALMAHGAPLAHAERVAASARYAGLEGGDVVIDLAGKRALLDQPATMAALAAHCVTEGVSLPSEAEASEGNRGAGKYDPVAAGRAAAERQRKANTIDPIAFT